MGLSGHQSGHSDLALQLLDERGIVPQSGRSLWDAAVGIGSVSQRSADKLDGQSHHATTICWRAAAAEINSVNVDSIVR